MDLIVPIDSAAEDGSSSGEEEILATCRPAKRQKQSGNAAKVDFGGLGDAVDTIAREEKPKPQSSWSFRDAIARIDATQGRRAGPTSSLQDKINLVKARKESAAAAPSSSKGNAPAAKSKKSARAMDDDDDDSSDGSLDAEIEEIEEEEEEEDVEGSDEDGDDDEEDGNEEDEDVEDGSDDSDADEEGEDGDDAEMDGAGSSDDEDEDEDEDEDAGSESDADGSSGGAAAVGGADEGDDILASAKPNPYRAKGGAGDGALPPELAKAYSKFFEPDPFSAAGKAKAKKAAAEADTEGDVLREMPAGQASAVAGKKRKREEESKAQAAASGSSSKTEAMASGAALKEPEAFTDMNLSRPLLKAVAALGYKAPTPIQRRTIPLALAGHDICGSAVTGSGKTAAYLLPILDRLLYKPSRVAATRVLVLVPTRELATQVHSMCSQLSQFCNDIRACLVVGGLSIKAQEAELRTRPDIVIATPGRMLDHIRNSASIHCDDVDVLVLDEADRLLEMGFEDEVTEVVKACPVGRQTLLFSATMTARVETLVKLSLRKPVRVTADPLYDMASRLVQEFVRIRTGREADREAILMALLARSFTGGGVLVFTEHKRTAHRLAILMGLAGLTCAELHGNLTQRQRLASLEDFRENRVDYLIATDLAGRGLDISGVRVVVNMEMPRDMTTYVHRVGRTARAGRSGIALTLVSESQRQMMKEIVKRATLNVRSRLVPADVVTAYREQIEGWAEDVEAVLAAEREERELRLAEMEANKASNMVDHEDEIAARPARTWFQTAGEKAALRAATIAKAKGLPAPGEEEEAAAAASKAKKGSKEDDKKTHRLTRRKRRRLEAAAEAEREAKRISRLERAAYAADKAAGKDGAGDDSDDEDNDRAAKAKRAIVDPAIAKAKKHLEAVRVATVGQYGIAKKAKSAQRAAQARSGMSAGMISRLQQKEKSGKSKKPRHGSGGGGGGGSAFDSEGGRPSGGSSSKESKDRKEKAHKHGSGSFHSKKRFKRR